MDEPHAGKLGWVVPVPFILLLAYVLGLAAVESYPVSEIGSDISSIAEGPVVSEWILFSHVCD